MYKSLKDYGCVEFSGTFSDQFNMFQIIWSLHTYSPICLTKADTHSQSGHALLRWSLPSKSTFGLLSELSKNTSNLFVLI